MNKILHIIYLLLLLLLQGAANAGYAQDQKKVMILGNVYGGGKFAQVIEPNADSIMNHIIQDADLATLFTTHTNHTYTTYVHLGENAEVYGRVFGGGKGKEDSEGETAGRVTGQTDVALDGATVWSEIFGGGEMADVRGNTLLHFKKGKAGHNAFGGGLGKLTEDTDENGVTLPDNRQTVLASADIKLIPSNYSLITDDNPTNLAELKALDLNTASNWMADKKTGESFVVFDGTEDSYTHYEFKTARTVNRDANGKAEKRDKNGNPDPNGLYYTETDQFDANRPEQLFSINHNIYGGGMTASQVEGKTFVHINYGMVNEEMMNFEHENAKGETEKVWSTVYNSIANAQFCVFGGGYGYHTDILGDANVTMDVRGSGQFKYINEFTKWFADEGKTKYGWDTNTGDPENIYKAADEATHSHGAPGRSCMDIVGGGYNGKVHGTTNVTVGGDVVLRKVYGGGYYSSVGNTNVTIKSGIFNRVYGGGLIGNVYGKANLTIGQQGTSDEVHEDNLHLLVKDAIYGGNDVSGTVGTSDAVNHTNAAGVTYHVYDPVDADNKGVRLNIYGGLVLGDVYGAGNGNHTGYGNPDYMEFNQSQHPSENYRTLTNAGEHGTNHVYKYRPRTARVEMTLQGNAGEDFNDDPQVDKVRIWGRTFGGGNSCNVGVWNGQEDDNAEVYADNTTSWHPGDNFQGGGTIQINIGSHVQFGNRNDSHETPNGLFMGSNGEHMITQHLDSEKARYYHQYWDSKAEKYYPGFVVYEDDANTPIKRSVGLKAFKAFINNILTKSDNVHLNIDDNAEDVWMSNFVGGGYRGSMQANSETGSFYYKLPKGVTVGHSVVGGAFNAHIIYRVYATDYGVGTYRTDSKGNYIYETIEPTDHPVISKAEAEEQGLAEYDYIKKLYEEGHEGDEAYKTGYVRYNFDGGMLAHDSEMNATNTGSRIHKIHDPNDEEALKYADFTAPTNGYFANKEKALVRLELKNRLHPAVHEATDTTALNVHGGIVYGGCYMTGYVEGDSWVDYDCSLSSLCTDERFFDKRNKAIYDEVADLNRNNALNIFGAGFGEDTHSMGDVYLCVQTSGGDTSSENGDWPFIYNVFGGSNMGTVAGSTNVYYDGGKQGTMLGSLYGGGFKGDIGGNTFVELVQGFLVNVYGGSRQANIGGAAHVWAYDGSTRASTGLTDTFNHLIICNMYGGNDISGTIKGTMEAIWTQDKWTDLATKRFNSYIQVSGTNSGTKGFPLVGNVYGGGNGEQWSEELGTAPDVGKSFLEIDGGTTLNAFGGGNKATITEEAWILVDAADEHYAAVQFTEYQKGILEDKFFKTVRDGYTWNGTELQMSAHHVDNLFGGNNVATMTIQPKWNLKQGRVGNVYSGGNMGDMTYYNPAAGTTDHEDELKGLCIEVNSDDIYIESLYGGCRMSDVKATLYEDDGEGNITETPQTFDEDDYGATVNVIKGHIGNIYGGNDVSGYVYNGTNVNLSGSITGNVYGAGNGSYLYAFDKEGKYVTNGMAEVWNNDVNKYVYWIPGAEGDSQLKQLVSLTNARPHVSKAYLNIQGQDENNKVYISGSVYCGGNASTIRSTGQETGEAHVKFNIGDNVIVNKVFMGSNGESMKYDANDKDNTYLMDFEKVNGLNFGTNMSEEVAPGKDHWDELLEMYGLSDDKKELIKTIYPNLLSVYMSAVDMKAMPLGFTEFSGHEFENTWIGTFCMGGNAGSMMTEQPVDIVFPQSLNFFGRIIGGSMDASFQYKGKWHRGGFRMPLASGVTLKDDNGDDQPTKTKLRMKIRGDWYSRRMVVDEAYKPNDYLARDKTNDGKDWDPDGKAWSDGCNVYGGCYQSGDMVGDVEIYIESDMLAYSRYLHDTPNATIDDYREPSLDESNKLNLPVANVYGAGYGPESRSYGDAYIYMKDIPNAAGWIHPSVNNIFGGGRNGMLIGNSVIHVHDGLVYKDVVGGSFAAAMYGSAQVTVGYPKFYVCKKTGEYFLNRADKWNEGYKTKGYNRNDDVVKKSIKYFEGTYVPCNVYDLITGVELAKTGATVDLSSDTYHPATRATNEYFDYHDESVDASLFPQGGWNAVEIRVRGGVYGGGYSLSNSTSAVAGSYTTLASTEQYNHGVDSEGNSSVGFGGNSSIIISDFVGEIPAGQEKKDHIKISTENPVVDKVYSGTGGIYGDGRLVFCEGFRAAELNGYGYAKSTTENPLMLNSMQRLDLLTINDCCFKLYGDQDFATDQFDAKKYSLARIGELRMNSSIEQTGNLAADKRNYIAFYNHIHYLGAIATNDDFSKALFHDYQGNVGTETYYKKKQEYIENWYASDRQTEAENTFKQRNYATARNMVGINSGFCLRVENQYYEGEEKKTYYGPIVGVCEMKLLNVQPGEGGGYVYADNVHADIYDPNNPQTPTFMNESGNFVFPSMVRPGEGESQYIVDDCLPQSFDEAMAGRAVHSDLPEQHYWYVIGDKYYYNATLTAFSYQTRKDFDLITSDPNVIFAGIEDGSTVSLESVQWQPATYPVGYTGDMRGGRDGSLKALSGSSDKYKFTLQIGNGDTWSQEMPRSTENETETIDQEHKPTSTYTATGGNPLPSSPQFNVHLIDNVNNCPVGQEEEYYDAHLSVPERVLLVVKSTKGGVTKTYNVTLDIVYIQGPSFTGEVTLKNCALPGEKIGFSSDGIEIKTTDQLPLTGFAWKLVPITREELVDDNMVYEWDATSHDAEVIPESAYTTALDGSVEGTIPALYNHNHWNVFFTFTAAGETFTVEPTKDKDMDLNKRMLVVHNYHRMKDVAAQGIEASVVPGARVYIKDVDDLKAFQTWVNGGKKTEGVDFILQESLKLPDDWEISEPFAGTLHGDGYVLEFNMGTVEHTLFGSQLTGIVYNLGMVGGTIATTGTRTNCYEYTPTDNFTYGAKAYELSHHFTPTTEGGATIVDDLGNADPTQGYVHNYYANGDYQYARHTDDWSLRTEESPNYGNTNTYHNTAHTHDAMRWNEVQKVNIPLFSTEENTTYNGAHDAYENDYLYFGQHLDLHDADVYPVHINPVANGDADDTKGGNRVYKTAGYYQSKNNEGFYYNKDAWALQPTLTAIDYTNMAAEGDDAATLPASFTVDSNKDCSPYNNATTGHVSQNLLVYNAGETFFDKKDIENIEEENIFYHNLVKDSDDQFGTDFFHLVDKQDFNAPIAFRVNERAWYERLPQTYRNVTTLGYENGSAWEGIVLPFTATKVSAEKNGEISHFYGIVPTEGQNDRTLHHEYWLRGFMGATTADAQTIATFERPAVSAPAPAPLGSTGCFEHALQNAASASAPYVYPRNSYFTGLYDYNNHYDTRDDEDADVMDKHDEAWYAKSHTFADYVPLTANVPYIVAFPGDDFYEFSMESYYKTDTYGKEDYKQKATFESGKTTIAVSDNAAPTIEGNYAHHGSYLHHDADYGINATGSAFVDGETILPFRTYLTVSSASPAPTRSIRIDEGIEHEEIGEPEEELGEQTLTFRVMGHDVVVTSTYLSPCPLDVYTAAGAHVIRHIAEPGETSFSLPGRGLYVIGGRKTMIP